MPDSRDIESLRQAAAVCKGCDLYKQATQTVFGRGAAPAAIMLIGEQPGDQEDPRISELKACMPSTAARALMGSAFRITQSRGQVLQGATGSSVIATWHPSAVPRAHGDSAEARRMFDELAGDLRLAASHSTTKPKASRRKTGC